MEKLRFRLIKRKVGGKSILIKRWDRSAFGREQIEAGRALLFSFLSVKRLLKCFLCLILRSRVQFSEDGAWRSELAWRKIWFWQYHALCQEHLLKVGVSGYTFWLLIPFLCVAPHKTRLNIRTKTTFRYRCHKVQNVLDWCL